MPPQRLPAITATLFFVFWLLVLLAGADKPPPPGFVWLIATVALCAAIVFWRVSTYLDWQRTRKPGRHWRVALDGAVAGLAVALPFALRGSGEPTITVRPLDYVIWFCVLAVLGMLNSVALYAINAFAARKFNVAKDPD